MATFTIRKGREGQMEGVDPRLMEILRQAAANAPPGISRVEAFSGKAGRSTGTKNHPAGRAVDYTLYDENGREIDNFVGKNISKSEYPAYQINEQFAQTARAVQQDIYPELNDRMRWGGYFLTGTPGDLMHLDLSGGLSPRTPPQTTAWQSGIARGPSIGAAALTQPVNVAAAPQAPQTAQSAIASLVAPGGGTQVPNTPTALQGYAPTIPADASFSPPARPTQTASTPLQLPPQWNPATGFPPPPPRRPGPGGALGVDLGMQPAGMPVPQPRPGTFNWMGGGAPNAGAVPTPGISPLRPAMGGPGDRRPQPPMPQQRPYTGPIPPPRPGNFDFMGGGAPGAPPMPPMRADDPTPYDTDLTPSEDAAFQNWFAEQKRQGKIHPLDTGADFDFRGAWKAGQTQGEGGHWFDTFKKPNHPTFSDESIYAQVRPDLAGHWSGDTYVPSPARAASMASMANMPSTVAPPPAGFQSSVGGRPEYPGQMPAAPFQSPVAGRQEVPGALPGDSRVAAIQSVIDQGVTDPTQIWTALNMDEGGNLVGDITPNEIQTVLGRGQRNAPNAAAAIADNFGPGIPFPGAPPSFNPLASARMNLPQGIGAQQGVGQYGPAAGNSREQANLFAYAHQQEAMKQALAAASAGGRQDIMRPPIGSQQGPNQFGPPRPPGTGGGSAAYGPIPTPPGPTSGLTRAGVASQVGSLPQGMNDLGWGPEYSPSLLTDIGLLNAEAAPGRSPDSLSLDAMPSGPGSETWQRFQTKPVPPPSAPLFDPFGAGYPRSPPVDRFAPAGPPGPSVPPPPPVIAGGSPLRQLPGESSFDFTQRVLAERGAAGAYGSAGPPGPAGAPPTGTAFPLTYAPEFQTNYVRPSLTQAGGGAPPGYKPYSGAGANYPSTFDPGPAGPPGQTGFPGDLSWDRFMNPASMTDQPPAPLTTPPRVVGSPEDAQFYSPTPTPGAPPLMPPAPWAAGMDQYVQNRFSPAALGIGPTQATRPTDIPGRTIVDPKTYYAPEEKPPDPTQIAIAPPSVTARAAPRQKTPQMNTGRQDLKGIPRALTGFFAPFVGGAGGGGLIGPNGFFSNAGSFTPSGAGGTSFFNQQPGGAMGTTNWRQGSVTGNPMMGGVMWNRSGDNGSVGYVVDPFNPGTSMIYSGSPNSF